MPSFEPLRVSDIEREPMAGRPRGGGVSSQFTVLLPDTLDALVREANFLHAERIIIAGGWSPEDFKRSGAFRARRGQPAWPEVTVHLIGTTHGDLHYDAFKYDVHRDNVRAVVMALHAERTRVRHGIGASGQGYRGFAQLTAGAGGEGSARRGEDLIRKAGSVAEALRLAHPDHEGDKGDFLDVMAAKRARDE